MTPFIPPGGDPFEVKKVIWADIEKAAAVEGSRTDGGSMRYALDLARQQLEVVCTGLLQVRFSGGVDRVEPAKKAWEAVVALEALCKFDPDQP
jgi:hypothetical protein